MIAATLYHCHYLMPVWDPTSHSALLCQESTAPMLSVLLCFSTTVCVLRTNLITFFWKSIKSDYKPETWRVRTLQYWCNTDFIIQVIGTSCLPSINLKWQEREKKEKKHLYRCRVPVSLNERYVYARAPRNKQKVVFDVWKIFSVVNRQILMFRLHKRLKLRKLFDMDIVIVTSYSFAHGHNVSAQCDVSVPARRCHW